MIEYLKIEEFMKETRAKLIQKLFNLLDLNSNN